ncbi:MAG: phage tail-like protein [Crocinitomicaceae bacterium]|jgi:phage tail-like protein
MTEIKPILQYRYVVKVIGDGADVYMRAQKVSGLGFTVNLEEIESTGGIKKMPSSISYEKLTLERAILETPEAANADLSELLNKLEVEPVDLSVFLTDAKGDYKRSWNIYKAYTIGWKTTDFDATSNSVLMETITFEFDKMMEIKI